MVTENNALAVHIDSIDESKFETEVVGFYPYWVPRISCSECGKELETRATFCKEHPEAELKGNRFLGTVLAVDENLEQPDPKKRFVRFTLQSQARMVCQAGAADSPEEVVVNPGEFFTCSDYAGLPLRNFFGITILATASGKRKMKDAQKAPMMVFSVKVDPATKRLLDENRQHLAKLAAEAQKAHRLAAINNGQEPKALPESTASAPAS